MIISAKIDNLKLDINFCTLVILTGNKDKALKIMTSIYNIDNKINIKIDKSINFKKERHKLFGVKKMKINFLTVSQFIKIRCKRYFCSDLFMACVSYFALFQYLKDRISKLNSNVYSFLGLIDFLIARKSIWFMFLIDKFFNDTQLLILKDLVLTRVERDGIVFIYLQNENLFDFIEKSRQVNVLKIPL